MPISEGGTRARGRIDGVRLLVIPPPEQTMNPPVATTLYNSDPQAPCPTRSAEALSLDESVERRERLLAASAAASRLLLQAPDVTAAVPEVLQLVGEAANVDRVDLMLAQPGPAGESRLVVASDGSRTASFRAWATRRWAIATRATSRVCAPSCARVERSHLTDDAYAAAGRGRCGGLHGAGTRSKAVVPIFVGGEFVGVVAFDACRGRRAIGTAELSALETAAGVIGAALHRERLVDAARRERERAADERAADLTSKNTALLRGLEQLAGEAELGNFLSEHVLVEMTDQLGAASGAVIVRDVAHSEWRVIAHVREGRVEAPPYRASLPLTVSLPFGAEAAAVQLEQKWRPIHFDLDRDCHIEWPGMLEHHRRQGHAGLLVLPLLFGQRAVGFVVLSFRPHVSDRLPRSDMLVALAQGATVAIELARRADAIRGRGRARRTQPHRSGDPRRPRAGVHGNNHAARRGGRARRDAGGSRPALLTRIRDLAREGLAEARRSVMALRPEQTRRNGLELALRQLAERSTIPGRVIAGFEGGGFATGLPPEHEHELLRIAQEAVSNAVRHGRPETLQIAMTDEETHWVLSVTDDGCGLAQAPELSALEGFGLASMSERASAIGGEWRIDSRRGAGTRVSVQLPKRNPS